MAKKTANKKNLIYDVLLQVENVEILALLTTSQSYQFVASLNKALKIRLQNKGAIEISSRNSTETCVLYTYIDEGTQLFYILLDIKNNTLDRLLQYYDKLLIINGDYNRVAQAERLVDISLPDTMECRRFDFGKESDGKIKQAMSNLRKFIVGDNISDGLLRQIECYLKNDSFLDGKKMDEEFFYF